MEGGSQPVAKNVEVTMPKQPDIPWKKHELLFNHRGQRVRACVFWWSKGYYIILKEPFESHIDGGNMMHAIPARFTIDNSSIIPRVKNVLILDKCKKLIREFLEKGGEE